MTEADLAGIEARPGVTTLPAHYRAFIRDYPAALWEAGFVHNGRLATERAFDHIHRERA